MPFYIAVHNPEKCQRCGMCGQIVSCPGEDESICYGCGACVSACPYEALELVEEPREGRVSIEVDGRGVQVPERIIVKDALKELGYHLTSSPEETGLFAPCGVGACWACAVEIDGEVKPACNVGVKEGMRIKTKLPEDYIPRRIVGGFTGFLSEKESAPYSDGVRLDPFPEVCCYVAGCNFRCPQCQSWEITYKGRGSPLTPEYTAKRLTKEREVREAERITMSISGGECTLNRPWLVQFIKELKKLNPDPEVHILVATNGSLLTHSYIDELWEAGLTDVVIGLKAWHIENFMRIAGLRDKDLAERYKETAWEAVRYICHKYKERIFLGVGLPYNEELNSITEIEAMGERLYHIDSTITVDLQNYRPEFRGKFSLAPDEEVDRVHKVLKGIGLEVVVYQTEDARIIGP